MASVWFIHYEIHTLTVLVETGRGLPTKIDGAVGVTGDGMSGVGTSSSIEIEKEAESGMTVEEVIGI